MAPADQKMPSCPIAVVFMLLCGFAFRNSLSEYTRTCQNFNSLVNTGLCTNLQLNTQVCERDGKSQFRDNLAALANIGQELCLVNLKQACQNYQAFFPQAKVSHILHTSSTSQSNKLFADPRFTNMC